MTTWRILWNKVLCRSKTLIPLLILSSSVYALSVIPMWLQKVYLERLDMFLTGAVERSELLLCLFIWYLIRSLTGGFLIPLGHASDLYYEYVITRNVTLSQHETNNRIYLEYYHSAPVFNLINRAKEALTSEALKETIGSLGSLLTLVISLSAMIGSLYWLDPLFAVISLASTTPLLVEQLIFSDKFFQMRRQITEKRRRQKQCLDHLIDKKYCLETRVAGAAGHFQSQWENYRQEIADAEIALQKSKLFCDLGLYLLKSLLFVLVIFLAADKLSQGLISIGDFRVVVSIMSILHASTSYFASNISNIYAHTRELQDIVQYYELEKDEADEQASTTAAITLDNVSYKYPGRQDFAVSNVSKRFEYGQKIAILGANGAGKSTLVNIIIGLYKPTQGTVLYGSKDLARANKQLLYPKMSAVFQDFNIYSLTIAENIAFSNAYDSQNKAAISKALELAGFNYRKFENQAETFIGKEFGGVELSRGESQQIAIARSYYNEAADIIVIDEPTAALDPIAEEKLYRRFVDIAGNKTTFIISHRLGSARIADRILVMDSAKIVEDGTHAELLQRNGLYAQMYRQQQLLYNQKTVELSNSDKMEKEG